MVETTIEKAVREGKEIIDRIEKLCYQCSKAQLERLIKGLEEIEKIKNHENKWFSSGLKDLAEYIYNLRFGGETNVD